jgi:NADH dehydrogenase
MKRNDPIVGPAAPGDERPHIVIVGGGFAGLEAAKELELAPVRVTLIDRENHHLFQPLLYQVATAALSAPDIAAPIRKVLRHQANATVLMGEVVGFDFDEKCVVLEDGHLPYDYLIVAAGMQTHYFGNDEWAEHAPGLKSIADAFDIRRRVLLAFEAAERESDPEKQKQWLTFVVIGAGPTGVELAGALSEVARKTLTANFRNFDPADARVILVEGLDRVLPALPHEDLSQKALEQLRDLEVEVRLETMIESIADDHVVTTDGTRIDTHTVLWAAGVKANDLAERVGSDHDKAGRVKVEPDLSVPGHPDVYVVGDMAHVLDDDGEPVPGLAPAAMQMGRHAAINIKRKVRREGEPRPFDYFDKGQMATIGRSKAIAFTGKLKFSGFIAWFAWLFIHILFLIGFRNRIAVLSEWAWAYITFQRSARVIVQGDEHAPPEALPPADDDVAAA